MTKQEARARLSEAKALLDFVAAEMTEESPDAVVVSTLTQAANMAIRSVERGFGTGQLWLDFDDI